ncbi:MAG: hypothetical protein H0U84_03575 [Thermoleophilaceae bacterium]|nr:hypothetical protein [Thermoleophilaceae bacterium]
MRVRRAGALGTIDVRSGGFGRADAAVRRSSGRGALAGGRLGSRPFDTRATIWDCALRRPVADVLRIKTRNVASVRVDVRRARVTCGVRLVVDSDGPLTVRLAGCPGR